VGRGCGAVIVVGNDSVINGRGKGGNVGFVSDLFVLEKRRE